MQRRFVVFLATAGLFVPAILFCDGPGIAHQLALAAATSGFLWLFARRSSVPPHQIVCAIIVATIGEVILSVVWGLYDYRFAILPLYVPVGHGLFYTLAAESARQPWLLVHRRGVTRWVLVAGSVIAAFGLLFLRDEWGLLWWIAAALLISRSQNKLLLSICFVYTMLLEWLGTGLGNWTWAAQVPLVGLHSANPPSGVGILYVLLDLVTVAICGGALTRLGEAVFARSLTRGGARVVFRGSS